MGKEEKVDLLGEKNWLISQIQYEIYKKISLCTLVQGKEVKYLRTLKFLALICF